MAAALGVSQSRVMHIETGRRVPRPATWARYMAALDLWEAVIQKPEGVSVAGSALSAHTRR
jgi:hypothetical protein